MSDPGKDLAKREDKPGPYLHPSDVPPVTEEPGDLERREREYHESYSKAHDFDNRHNRYRPGRFSDE